MSPPRRILDVTGRAPVGSRDGRWSWHDGKNTFHSVNPYQTAVRLDEVDDDEDDEDVVGFRTHPVGVCSFESMLAFAPEAPELVEALRAGWDEAATKALEAAGRLSKLAIR